MSGNSVSGVPKKYYLHERGGELRLYISKQSANHMIISSLISNIQI